MTPDELRIREPLPSKVKIGGMDYRIEDWHPTAASAQGKLGQTDNCNLIIRIDTSFPRHQTADTLLHEIMHAVYRVWQIAEDDKEERVVGTMASAMCAVWRDNPGVMAWISRHLAA